MPYFGGLKGKFVLASLLVGLREGLEAATIVAILVAYLVNSDLRRYISRVWIGVGAAVAVSLGVAGGLSVADSALSDEAAELFEGLTSLAAVALITWMTFWMANHARSMKRELHGKVDRALGTSAFALGAVAFFAVLREGLETSIFMWASIQAAGTTTEPLVGLAIGLIMSIAAGIAIFKGVVRINIGKVFTVVGGLLIFVAAGVLAYGVHELEEFGAIPFGGQTVIDTSSAIDPEGVIGSLMRGFLGYRGMASQIEIIAWVGYVIIVGLLYKRQLNKRSPKPVAPAETANV